MAPLVFCHFCNGSIALHLRVQVKFMNYAYEHYIIALAIWRQEFHNTFTIDITKSQIMDKNKLKLTALCIKYMQQENVQEAYIL